MKHNSKYVLVLCRFTHLKKKIILFFGHIEPTKGGGRQRNYLTSLEKSFVVFNYPVLIDNVPIYFLTFYIQRLL